MLTTTTTSASPIRSIGRELAELRRQRADLRQRRYITQGEARDGIKAALAKLNSEIEALEKRFARATKDFERR